MRKQLIKAKRAQKNIKAEWIYRMHAKRYCFAADMFIDYKNNEEGD